MTEDLPARLAAIESRLELLHLEATYAPAADSGDGEAWADLFLPDGIYQSRNATPAGGGTYARGRDALVRVISEAPWSQSIHLPYLPQIVVDGDTATGRIHFEWIGQFRDEGATRTRAVGYYDVAYRRVDGRWLIKHRVTTTFLRDNQSVNGYPALSAFDDPAFRSADLLH